MLTIAGRPILEHNVRLLAKHGITDLIVNTHHCARVIESYFGDGSRFGVRIQYSRESILLGTAGALKPMRSQLQERFLVLYGDNLSTCDVTSLVRSHRPMSLATIAVFERPDVEKSGVLELDSDDNVLDFIEKPSPGATSSHWVNAGIILLEPSIFDSIPSEGATDFGRDVFPAALRAGARVHAYKMKVPAERLWWIDSPADYERTRIELSKGVPVA